MSRYVNCSLLISKSPERAVRTFLNDWARTLGAPMRIVTGRCSPGISGKFWSGVSHVFGRQMTQSPTQSPHRNGLDERSTMSLKLAVWDIIRALDATCRSQEISTQSAIAKNHAPRDTAGIPSALAMPGRCDMMAGRAFTAFNRDPEDDDSLLRATNTTWAIMNARNALIFNDATAAIRAMLSRKAPGRPSIFSDVSDSVRIALGGGLIGAYFALAALRSNLILEKDGKVSKLPKCKTRKYRMEIWRVLIQLRYPPNQKIIQKGHPTCPLNISNWA